MSDPSTDAPPGAPAQAPAPAPPPEATPLPPSPPARSSFWPPTAIAAIVGMTILGVLHFVMPPPPPAGSSVVTIRPSASLLVAIRDLARLETTELHIEKVIDLSDKQSRLFGLIEASDALLLVAAGDVTIGVDLSKLGEGDVTMDPATGVATLRLPSPEILSARLDEKGTYVYTRTTDVLARRNESLEAKARQEALAAIERAAKEADTTARSKAQAERSLRSLATQLGAKRVDVSWR